MCVRGRGFGTRNLACLCRLLSRRNKPAASDLQPDLEQSAACQKTELQDQFKNIRGRVEGRAERRGGAQLDADPPALPGCFRGGIDSTLLSL